MKNLIDDGLDEYVEEQNLFPAVPPTAAPQQQKSAELADLEKTLEVLRNIKKEQDEMRNTITELTVMTEKAKSISKQLSDGIREAKPIWDDLLGSFVNTIAVSDESMAKFNELMLTYANQIVSNSCSLINKAVTENITGQFTEVANQHIVGFDQKMRKVVELHNTALSNLEKEYEDKISSLENKQGKLLAQVVDEQNIILLPTIPFFAITGICILITLCGIINWVMFCRGGNADIITYMLFAVIVFFEFIYYTPYVWNCVKWYKKKKEDSGIFRLSLSQTLYIMSLTFSAGIYIVVSQVSQAKIITDTWLLYILPLTVASNLIWSVLKAIVTGGTKT